MTPSPERVAEEAVEAARRIVGHADNRLSATFFTDAELVARALLALSAERGEGEESSASAEDGGRPQVQDGALSPRETAIADYAARESRRITIEQCACAVESMRPCPFDKGQPAPGLSPDDPCPVCGNLGTFALDKPSNCQSAAAIIRALAAATVSEGEEQGFPSSSTERNTSLPARGEVIEDAERWRAFMSSMRFKTIGSAGFDWIDKLTPKAIAKHLHFGLEVWNDHPAGDDPQGQAGRKLLNAYVDELVRRRSLPKDRG